MAASAVSAVEARLREPEVAYAVLEQAVAAVRGARKAIEDGVRAGEGLGATLDKTNEDLRRELDTRLQASLRQIEGEPSVYQSYYRCKAIEAANSALATNMGHLRSVRSKIEAAVPVAESLATAAPPALAALDAALAQLAELEGKIDLPWYKKKVLGVPAWAIVAAGVAAGGAWYATTR